MEDGLSIPGGLYQCTFLGTVIHLRHNPTVPLHRKSASVYVFSSASSLMNSSTMILPSSLMFSAGLWYSYQKSVPIEAAI